jgi:hypothetical protein
MYMPPNIFLPASSQPEDMLSVCPSHMRRRVSAVTVAGSQASGSEKQLGLRELTRQSATMGLPVKVACKEKESRAYNN